MIEITKASLRFGQQTLFQDVSLRLPNNAWTCILGKTGCGKSSLLKLLAGIIPESDQASFETPYQDLKQSIAYMAQSDLLMPWLTVYENLFLGHKLSGVQVTPEEEEKAHKLLQRVGLLECAQAYPKSLSGGMKQRIALVRTLMQNKPIVFMDEPFSALDAITRYQMQELAFECLQGKSVLLITHDPLEALRLGHQILIMTPEKKLKSMELPEFSPLRDVDDPSLPRLQKVLIRQLESEDEHNSDTQ